MQEVIEFIRGISDGGAETLVKEYATLLNGREFTVKVVALFERKSCANSKILREKNIEVITIYPNWNIISKMFNKLFGKWFVPYKINKILKRDKPIAIHAHMTVLRYLLPIHKNLNGIRLFHTCHSLPERNFGKGQSKEHKAAKYLIVNNNLRLIALHNDMAKELNKLFEINNTLVIHNAIDFTRFMNVVESKNEVRKSLGIPENSYLMGHVGRFHPLKNHRFLVEIFYEVKKKKENAYLLMVGAGDELSQIIQLIKSYGLEESVLILSNRTDIPTLMRAMDVFVFPSILEGLGIVLIESQISGLRSIVSSAVPEEAFITELAIPLSLSLPASYWSDVILNEKIKGTYKGNIEDYDMSKEIKKLESLYAGN